MTPSESRAKRLGDFEIIRELGRGGMGIVFEARQISLNRRVALKVISGSLGLSSTAVMRFQREAEAAGKLHHTNIVPIYSTGDDDGQHYYAMELIDGPSLDDVIRSLRQGETSRPTVSDSAATIAAETALPKSATPAPSESSSVVETPGWVSEILGAPPVSATSASTARSGTGASSTPAPSASSYFDSVASMIAGVADALGYAHENGVIHRDIKPANLLLSKDGRVSINDFGLARMLEQPGMTMSGEFVGSPLYMSPEQITAGRAPLDHRTDIYSLGATLYELLTLERVFPGRSRDEVIAQILHKEPVPPRRQNPKVPVDLETICLKALEKDPDRRYPSAGLLAADLRRFVQRHAISARRIGPLERAIRWARKNKALTSMATLTVVVIVGAATYVELEQRRVQRDQAMDQAVASAMSGDLKEATVAIEEARKYGAESDWTSMLTGQVELFKGDSARAVEQLEIATSLQPDSVTAHSLLTYAYGASGRWSDYERKVRELQKMKARTPRAKLLQGAAIFFFEIEECLELMDEAIRENRNLWIGRALRAQMRSFYALESSKPEQNRAAILDLDVASESLEDNSVVLVSRLDTKLAEFAFQRRDRQDKAAQKQLDEAVPYAELLKKKPHYLLGNFKRLHLYRLRYALSGLDSELATLEEVMRDVVDHGHTGFIVVPYASAMLRSGRNEQGLKRLRRGFDQDNRYFQEARALLLMETEEGRREAEELLRGQNENFSVFLAPVFLLLGKKDEVTRAAKEHVRSKGRPTPGFDGDLELFHAGEIGGDALIERAGTSQTKQASAHFHIGTSQLAEGDRREALESFQRAAATLVYQWGPTTYAQAIAARMADPNWPDWLPAKSVDSEDQ